MIRIKLGSFATEKNYRIYLSPNHNNREEFGKTSRCPSSRIYKSFECMGFLKIYRLLLQSFILCHIPNFRTV